MLQPKPIVQYVSAYTYLLDQRCCSYSEPRRPWYDLTELSVAVLFLDWLIAVDRTMKDHH